MGGYQPFSFGGKHCLFYWHTGWYHLFFLSLGWLGLLGSSIKFKLLTVGGCPNGKGLDCKSSAIAL
jgi:hypothetical protein